MEVERYGGHYADPVKFYAPYHFTDHQQGFEEAPGVEVELKEAQVNWVDKEQKLRIHLELDAEVTKAQLNDILKKAGVL